MESQSSWAVAPWSQYFKLNDHMHPKLFSQRPWSQIHSKVSSSMWTNWERRTVVVPSTHVRWTPCWHFLLGSMRSHPRLMHFFLDGHWTLYEDCSNFDVPCCVNVVHLSAVESVSKITLLTSIKGTAFRFIFLPFPSRRKGKREQDSTSLSVCFQLFMGSSAILSRLVHEVMGFFSCQADS